MSDQQVGTVTFAGVSLLPGHGWRLEQVEALVRLFAVYQGSYSLGSLEACVRNLYNAFVPHLTPPPPYLAEDPTPTPASSPNSAGASGGSVAGPCDHGFERNRAERGPATSLSQWEEVAACYPPLEVDLVTRRPVVAKGLGVVVIDRATCEVHHTWVESGAVVVRNVAFSLEMVMVHGRDRPVSVGDLRLWRDTSRQEAANG